MGKKSKAARAKAKAGAAASSGAPSGGGTSGGAMVISSGKKKQNCVRCFGTVRADKGSVCPECSLVYCWRCEKKAFEGCPSSDCVHPIRRCQLCARGDTAIRALAKKEVGPGDLTKLSPLWARFQQYIEEDDTLSLDANCFPKCSDCAVTECFRCLLDSVPRRLLSCGSCGACRCNDCSREKYHSLVDGRRN